jgi:phospholipid N-methyltransferase
LNGNGHGHGTQGIRLEIGQRWRFLSRYFRSPNTVGAIAPSSRALAVAVCGPFRNAKRPASVLEIGAGTGAVTRYLGTLLGPADRLDICEISQDFADILERDLLSGSLFADAVAEGRVRLLRQAVQKLPPSNRYDFIISGLPLTSFELRDVEEVFAVIRRSLNPGGVFSYFEYVALRRTSRALALGKRRRRIRDVSRFLAKNIRQHQFAHQMIMPNFPPAHVRHLRFK